jgi:hypothetical protein
MAGTTLRANSVHRIGEGILSVGLYLVPKGFCKGTENRKGFTKDVTNNEGVRQLIAA